MIDTERTPHRLPCAQCNGTGAVTSPAGRCDVCRGQGFVNLESGYEVICPSCNGEGRTVVTRLCRDCNGRSYRVVIYEFADDINVCSLCTGTGSIEERLWFTDLYGDHVQVRQVRCPRCFGSGSTGTFSNRTIK